MRTITLTSVVPLLPLLARTAHAVCGIRSFTSCDDNIVHWFDPLTGEVCDPVDCGGGRAPPKTGPGCPGYTGTVVLSVSYLSCWTPSSSTPPSTSATSTDPADGTPPAATTSSKTSARPFFTTLATGAVTDGGSLTTPSTTLPATLPTDLTTGAAGSGTGGTTAQPQPTANAGNLVHDPWRTALGAVVIGGGIALL